MNTPDDLTDAQWFTSSYSSGQGACVEVARLPGKIATRDTKDRSGPVLLFPTDEWQHFITAVNDGEISA
jgi:hypothetical protein